MKNKTSTTQKFLTKTFLDTLHSLILIFLSRPFYDLNQVTLFSLFQIAETMHIICKTGIDEKGFVIKSVLIAYPSNPAACLNLKLKVWTAWIV